MVTECEIPPPAAVRIVPYEMPPIPQTAVRVTTPSGVSYEDQVVGDGPEVARGQNVSWRYQQYVPCSHSFRHDSAGSLSVDGRTFDRGATGMISGSYLLPEGGRPWAESGALSGMREGGRRRVFVPYSEGGILTAGPPGAFDQIYDVEIHSSR
jgi:FKBP-type peptidyl-prolyl cis-trans isomerase